MLTAKQASRAAQNTDPKPGDRVVVNGASAGRACRHLAGLTGTVVRRQDWSSCKAWRVQLDAPIDEVAEHVGLSEYFTKALMGPDGQPTIPDDMLTVIDQ